MKERPNKWSLNSAKKCIMNNSGKIQNKKIFVTDVGIKVQGAVDYLVNYCGYRRV